MLGVLDVLFPPHCVACGVFDCWWCSACQRAVEAPKAHAIDGLDGFAALGMYHDPILRSVVHGLKYRGGTCLLPHLEFFLETRLEKMTLPWEACELIGIQHIPTDPEREKERGFDQAKLIAKTALPFLHPQSLLLDALIRMESRGAQAQLEDAALRQANAHGVYQLQTTQLPQAVVLVDDVSTTGASMVAAAQCLRAAGVERVYGFALAIGA